MEEIEEIKTVSIKMFQLSAILGMHFRCEINETEGYVHNFYSRDVYEFIINGKPYYCGSGRCFSKKSFMEVMAKIVGAAA